jgi:type 1 fimbria pilin
MSNHRQSNHSVARAVLSARRAAWVLAAALVSTRACADCTWSNGQSLQTYTFAIPSLSVSRDTPVGTVVYDAPQQAGIPQSGAFATCSSNGVANRSVTGGALVSSNPYTFATNVAGLGVRFYDLSKGYTRYWGAGDQETYNSTWTWSGTQLGMQIVVTGPVGSGSVNGSVYGSFTLGGTLTIAYLRMSSFPITANACTITTPSVSVSMPKAFVNALTAIGSTTGQQSFNIGLNCSANIRVFVTLSDSVTSSNTSNVLTLKKGSSAQGVGLQILSQGTPVNFGADSAVAGTAGQVQIGTAAGGPMNIPLVVQYIRTASPVVPGSVDGLVTFTLSYQ